METEILKAFVWVSSRFGPVLACSSRVLAVFADLRGFHPFFVAPKVKLLSSGQLLDELPEVFDSLLAVVDQERMIYLRHQAAVERELQAVRRSQAVVKRMRGKGQRQAELLGLWSTSYVSTEIDGTQRALSRGSLKLSEEKALVERLKQLRSLEACEEQVIAASRAAGRVRDRASWAESSLDKVRLWCF